MHLLLKKKALKNTYKHDERRWPPFFHDNMLPPIVEKLLADHRLRLEGRVMSEGLSRGALILSASIIMSGVTMLRYVKLLKVPNQSRNWSCHQQIL